MCVMIDGKLVPLSGRMRDCIEEEDDDEEEEEEEEEEEDEEEDEDDLNVMQEGKKEKQM